ncbi:nitrogen fixation protein NifQ [Xanthobacter sp. DSM 24535]|uniref:nitrogen fixation protein NifQ n=1 Tax=Roseixanthobacter psychrophilus TaxID=3119917 RepID=UPI00372AAD15
MIDPALGFLRPLAQLLPGRDAGEHPGIAAYRLLTGISPNEAVIADDISFDRHILASILAAAAMEGGPVAEHAGLSQAELSALLAHWFPRARPRAAMWWTQTDAPPDEEIAMVRDLLRAKSSSDCDTTRWLAAMIARRAMEPNHLWEDLGLRTRSELTRLITRHFASVAARNTNNMRWKRLLYRMLCEDDGFVMCAAPVCTQCNDFAVCFSDESGESRMAERRRTMAQADLANAVPASSQPS